MDYILVSQDKPNPTGVSDTTFGSKGDKAQTRSRARQGYKVMNKNVIKDFNRRGRMKSTRSKIGVNF
ncbi:hypothetical protein PN36_30705 [Candidatus Thiomargarita nelsonii]|uniref:Uncharacterized protein n=1 Tax=Candidatus Thiomargarita nelsonii TaxID=1003181 RepID=A0A0A6PAZ1_9GAMM|nr:hypothetical protein PN36_20865 [Candidatus Thiomargarita nelsonii]TGO02089.1 hypothetical protein PN36_30705 [Candidatus Thiomargarita nelsonii]